MKKSKVIKLIFVSSLIGYSAPGSAATSDLRRPNGYSNRDLERAGFFLKNYIQQDTAAQGGAVSHGGFGLWGHGQHPSS